MTHGTNSPLTLNAISVTLLAFDATCYQSIRCNDYLCNVAYPSSAWKAESYAGTDCFMCLIANVGFSNHMLRTRLCDAFFILFTCLSTVGRETKLFNATKLSFYHEWIFLQDCCYLVQIVWFCKILYHNQLNKLNDDSSKPSVCGCKILKPSLHRWVYYKTFSS